MYKRMRHRINVAWSHQCVWSASFADMKVWTCERKVTTKCTLSVTSLIWKKIRSPAIWCVSKETPKTHYNIAGVWKRSKPKQIENLNKAICCPTEETTKPKKLLANEISEDFTNLIALTFYDDEPWNGIVKGQSQSREASQSEVKIYDA